MEEIINILKEMGASNINLTDRDTLTWKFNGKTVELKAVADYDVAGYGAELSALTSLNQQERI